MDHGRSAATCTVLWFKIVRFLTWKQHVQNIHRMIAGYLALLSRIKKYFPLQTRKTFYNCYILKHMDHCSRIWGSAPSSERIRKLQKRAARIITYSEYRAESAQLMNQLYWLPLPVCVKYSKHNLFTSQ